ncbi:uncharacterized protein LOC119965405 isoform X2 [Scyliorhinus canicula]|uniref:uncharacterized protein LOC119965405 isoform X2 n=1 Tax=Scyliorhinus canicula TaxID=7830 RepID=UPI0018F65124|nr:uncharacterized protein LOC119965405 isoform X2 [Scyliorhinus canicula]
MLRGLMISFIFLLHRSAHTQDPITIYLPVGKMDLVLNGSDIPAQGTILWDWTPHCGESNTRTLVKMKAEEQGWSTEWVSEYMKNFGTKWHQINASLNLKIENAAFATAGLFTCRQTEPKEKVLKQYEIFAIKVERDSRYLWKGGDTSLSCTISRLSETVSLQWKTRDFSQQNQRNNTDQIQLNNTVYLIVQDVQVDDVERYACEIQDNGRTVLSIPITLYLSPSEFGKEYTSYWPIFDHGLIDLSCKSKSKQNVSTWYWRNNSQITGIRLVSSADKKDERNINNLDIQNRISLKNFDGMSFPLQISPAQFEDAGNYQCTMDTMHLVKIELITIQVSAIPSHPLTEGDSVSLACSISHVRNQQGSFGWIMAGIFLLKKKHLISLDRERTVCHCLFRKLDNITEGGPALYLTDPC